MADAGAGQIRKAGRQGVEAAGPAVGLSRFYLSPYSVHTEITDTDAITGPRGQVFYDAECALCVGLAGRFRGLLRRRRIDLRPLQAVGVSARLGIRAQD